MAHPCESDRAVSMAGLPRAVLALAGALGVPLRRSIARGRVAHASTTTSDAAPHDERQLHIICEAAPRQRRAITAPLRLAVSSRRMTHMAASWRVLPSGHPVALSRTQELLLDMAPVAEDLVVACLQLDHVRRELSHTAREAHELAVRSRRQRLKLRLLQREDPA